MNPCLRLLWGGNPHSVPIPVFVLLKGEDKEMLGEASLVLWGRPWAAVVVEASLEELGMSRLFQIMLVGRQWRGFCVGTEQCY